MVENMTAREKNLAIVVGAMVPIVVMFLAFFWFMDRYEANYDQIDELTANVKAQEDIKERGLAASQRQSFYRKTSLPTKSGLTQSIYKTWLDNVVIKECGMSYNGPRMKPAGNLDFDRNRIARRNAFTISPKGTLEQLTKFLHIFYSADHMHRINKLSAKAIGKSERGKPEVLTGELRMLIEIETLSMSDGPDNIESFPVWQQQLASLDQYTEKLSLIHI